MFKTHELPPQPKVDVEDVPLPNNSDIEMSGESQISYTNDAAATENPTSVTTRNGHIVGPPKKLDL